MKREIKILFKFSFILPFFQNPVLKTAESARRLHRRNCSMTSKIIRKTSLSGYVGFYQLAYLCRAIQYYKKWLSIENFVEALPVTIYHTIVKLAIDRDILLLNVSVNSHF